MAYPSYAAPCIGKGSIRDLETYRLPNFRHWCHPIGELCEHAVPSNTPGVECGFSCVLQVRKSGLGFSKKSAGQTPHFCLVFALCREYAFASRVSFNHNLQPQVKRYGRVSWWPRLLLFASSERLDSTPSRFDGQPF
jgi:hypothetical protein